MHEICQLPAEKYFAPAFAARNKRATTLSFIFCCVMSVSCTYEATAERNPQKEASDAKEEQKDASGTASSAAFGGTMDGQTVYEKGCASCHESGFNGAPRPVAGDWPYAREYGVDHYTRIAIQGIGIMPARGGHPDLRDSQIRSAVRYLFNRMGIPITEKEAS